MALRVGLTLALLGLTALGCRMNDQQTKLQYMPDMADNPINKTQKDYLDPPAGAIPRHAVLVPTDQQEAIEVMENPLDEQAMHLEKGKELWNNFCIACHGPQGKGKHKLGPNFPVAPDLTAAVYQERKDSFYFHVITYGGAIMPAYGYAIYPKERWQIVRYIRELQKAGE